MNVFEPPVRSAATSGRPQRMGGFTLPELLVTTAIIVTLASLTAAAVSQASGSRKKLRTRSLIAKIDAIVTSQYESYAGRTVAATTNTARGEALRALARADLPDDWVVVQELADRAAHEADQGSPSGAPLTSRQRAYVAVWNSVPASSRSSIPAEHSAAECLFLAVMHGGLSNCLDCDALRIDVGDRDQDGMPEFLDDWGNPIGFILQPKNLQLPPGCGKNFFSPALPFDPVAATALDPQGGLVRPLIVSAGPDGAFGLRPDGGPVAESTDSIDNLTNFDEEARL